MTGGEAFVLDEESNFDQLCNTDFVELESVKSSKDTNLLKDLIETHYQTTESPKAKEILDNFDVVLNRFVKVMPSDYKRILESKEQTEIVSTVT
jgi:glutamate synthase domain-containing protein 3